ncbi:MAG: hypothetical protein NC421_07745 [Lachnospiraceae bacterium]|nr:hypothetical protein [Lachnospiraceae bacterium]
MKKSALSIIPICCIMASCNNRNDDIGWKLRNPDEENKKEIIENKSTRFISPQVKMVYDDGGIMVKKSDATISFFNIINGEEAEFKYVDDKPSLKINGKSAEIKTCEILNKEDSDIWLRIIMIDNDSIEIVVTDIDTP